MKLKENFITNVLCGQHFLVQVGSGNTILQLNNTAAFIVECLQEDVTEAEIVNRVLEKYDISKDVAEPAVSRILAQLQEYTALQD